MSVLRFFLILLAVLISPAADAHKFAPSLLVLSERPDHTFAVSWKTPRFSATPVPLVVRLPAACAEQDARSWGYEGTGVKLRWTVRCSQPLRGQRIEIAGLADNQAMALLRIEWMDGAVQQATLTAVAPTFLVPEQTGRLQVAADYLRLGVHHILAGLDHLLFVLGLILLVTGAGKLVWTITAFTVGHSVTLALATLGILRYPVDLIELLIAASIFVIAIELTRADNEQHWLRKRPWLAAIGFGLLHGMGFAGALLEAGLPAHAIPLALLFFNVGIEIGQLLFVAVVLLLGVMWRRYAPASLCWMRWAPIYAIGIGSAFWCLERAGAILTGAG
jgi:hydrogenase/urease accessory protein HupE